MTFLGAIRNGLTGDASLLVGVGLKLLKVRDVQVADYLPAIAIAPLLVAAASAVGGLVQ